MGRVFLAPVTASAQTFFFTPFSSSQAWLSRLRFGLVRQETVKGVDSAGTEALIAFCCLFPEPPTSTYATTDILTFKAFLSLRCNVSSFFFLTLFVRSFIIALSEMMTPQQVTNPLLLQTRHSLECGKYVDKYGAF